MRIGSVIETQSDHRIGLCGTFALHAAFVACVWTLVSEAPGGSSEVAGSSRGSDGLFVAYVAIPSERIAPGKQPTEAAERADSQAVDAVEASADADSQPVTEPVIASAPMETAPVAPVGSEQQATVIGGEDAGSQGQGDSDLEARYVAALRTAILKQMGEQSASRRGSCQLRIIQVAGGNVLQAQALNCQAGSSLARAAEAAALMAQPLPYAGFESVFRQSREFVLEL